MLPHVVHFFEWPRFATLDTWDDGHVGWVLMSPKPEFVAWAKGVGIGEFEIEVCNNREAYLAANDNFSEHHPNPFYRSRVSFAHARDMIFFKCYLEDLLDDA